MQRAQGTRLEVRADCVNLVDKVLHADDAVLAEGLLNNGVLRQRDALLVDLAEPALVDELLNLRTAVGQAYAHPLRRFLAPHPHVQCSC